MSYTTEIVQASNFDGQLLERAFGIYQMCYEPTSKVVFDADFLAKSYAVLIHKDGALVGFSTVEFTRTADGRRTLFSGDTVTHPDHWGTQALPIAWLGQAGKIWAQAPNSPLYWMLITKGHRTYRYLPAFSLDYQPSPDWPMPAQSKALIDELATCRFGPRYDAQTGVIAADIVLPTHVSEAAMGHSNSRHSEFFRARNPGFRRGDELVTLCKLAPDTLTPRARNWFVQHVDQA